MKVYVLTYTSLVITTELGVQQKKLLEAGNLQEMDYYTAGSDIFITC